MNNQSNFKFLPRPKRWHDMTTSERRADVIGTIGVFLLIAFLLIVSATDDQGATVLEVLIAKLF